MKTKLIPGKAARSNDAAVMVLINKCARDGGGNTMVIGLRNDAGEIYRLVEAVGLGEFMGIVSALSEGVGLKDELADGFVMKDGCDAIFS